MEESILRWLRGEIVLEVVSIWRIGTEYGSFPLGGVYAEYSEVLGVRMTDPTYPVFRLRSPVFLPPSSVSLPRPAINHRAENHAL